MQPPNPSPELSSWKKIIPEQAFDNIASQSNLSFAPICVSIWFSPSPTHSFAPPLPPPMVPVAAPVVAAVCTHPRAHAPVRMAMPVAAVAAVHMPRPELSLNSNNIKVAGLAVALAAARPLRRRQITLPPRHHWRPFRLHQPPWPHPLRPRHYCCHRRNRDPCRPPFVPRRMQ